MNNHNPLCQQAMDIDPEVPNCICDWVDAAQRDTEARIIKLLLEHPLCIDVDYITYCDCSEEATEMDYKDHLLALIEGQTE